jgi:hypothetical protein
LLTDTPSSSFNQKNSNTSSILENAEFKITISRKMDISVYDTKNSAFIGAKNMGLVMSYLKDNGFDIYGILGTSHAKTSYTAVI